MDNKQLYKKTLGFSLRRLLWNVISILIFAGLCAAGFGIGSAIGGAGPWGLLIGAVVGLIVVIFITRFISYTFKAGQIAMMTRGVVEGSLPDNVIAEGKAVVKERFATVAAYYLVTRAIKGIFRQIGRGITRIGEAIGGDTGGAVGSTINGVIQVVINYLSDCCLGWVFFRKEVGAVKATCEGSVIFFKHGKTFAKNMGRVFGIGLASLVVIGGAFGGALYLLFTRFGEFFTKAAAWLAENTTESEGKFADLLRDPTTLTIVCAVIGGIIIWGIIHSVFIKPFVLTGVLRNYLNSGMADVPSEDSFAALDAKSSKFRKLRSKI